RCSHARAPHPVQQPLHLYPAQRGKLAGQIEQDLIGAGPTDQGQTGGATRYSSDRKVDLRKTAKTSAASQTPGPPPQSFEGLARGRHEWGNRRRSRQGHDRAWRQAPSNVRTRSSKDFTGLTDLLAGDASGEIHALLYSRTELRLCRSDESAKGFPHLSGLHDPKSFAPRVETCCCNGFFDTPR